MSFSPLPWACSGPSRSNRGKERGGVETSEGPVHIFCGTSKEWGKLRHVRPTFLFVGHQPSSQRTFTDERFAGAGDLARAAAGDLLRAADGDLARAVAGDLVRADGVLALADGDLRAAPKQYGVSCENSLSLPQGVSGQQKMKHYPQAIWLKSNCPSIHPSWQVVKVNPRIQ